MIAGEVCLHDPVLREIVERTPDDILLFDRAGANMILVKVEGKRKLLFPSSFPLRAESQPIVVSMAVWLSPRRREFPPCQARRASGLE